APGRSGGHDGCHRLVRPERAGLAPTGSLRRGSRGEVPVSTVPNGTRHRVVIVGSGFGGLFAAKALRRAPVDITIIDRTNHHLFQPLLYQVATGILSEGQIA